jgi:hypothetical protein
MVRMNWLIELRIIFDELLRKAKNKKTKEVSCFDVLQNLELKSHVKKIKK